MTLTRALRYLLAVAGAGVAFGLWLLLHSGSAGAITPENTPENTATGAGCTRYWMGWTSTDWHTTSNWSSVDGGFGGAALPGAGDVVCMATAPVNANVSLTGTPATIGGIQFGAAGSVSPTLTITSTTLTVNGTGGVIHSLNLAGGTLNGAADVHLTGSSQVSAASYLYGVGIKTVDAGATLSVAETLTVGDSSCASPAHLVISGTAVVTDNGITMCSGMTTSTATTMVVNGRVNFTHSGRIVCYDLNPIVPPMLINNGQIVGPGPTTAEVVFVAGITFANLGTVDAAGGYLEIDGSGAPSLPDSGSYISGTGGSIYFYSGNREFSGGSISGDVLTDETHLTFDTDYAFDYLQLTKSTVDGAASLTLTSFESDKGSDPTNLPSQVGLPIDVTNHAEFYGLEMLTGASITLHGTAIIGTSAGDITMDPGSRLIVYGALTVQDPTPAGIRSVAGTSTQVEFQPGSTLQVNSPFTIAPDLLVMDAATTVGATGRLTIGGGLPSTDVYVVDNTWQVAAHGSLIFATSTEFGGYGSVTGPGAVTQLAGVTFSFFTPYSFASLSSSGSLVGSVSVGNFTARNTHVTGPSPAGPTTLALTGRSSIAGMTVDDATVVNSGTTAIRGARAVRLVHGGQLVDAGTMTFASTAAVSVSGDGSANSGLILNAGSTMAVTLNSASASTAIAAPVTNNGTLRVKRGTLALTGPVSNLSSGVLLGGTWWADGGTLALPTAVTVNDATITLAATPNSAITVAGGTTPALATLAANDGTLTLAQPLTLTSAFATKGALTIAAGLHAPGFAMTGGTVTLTGDLYSTSPVSVTGGTLTGTGKVDAALTNNGGIIAPGVNGVGTLSINGSFTQTSGSVQVTLTKSELDVSGNAALGGTLALRTPRPHPATGTAASALVTVGTVSGHFATVTGRAVAGTSGWHVTYTSNTVTCTLTA